MGNQVNIPTLRFPEFEGEWNKKKLGDLLEFKNGINASKEQYGKGVKFINVLDILNNDFITHDKIIGSVDVDVETANLYSVKYGDILFQRSSETREEVGSANVYVDKNNNATFGGFVIRGRKIGEYVPEFLNKLLKTNSARDEITSKSGGSTRYNVGQGTLSSVELLFPSLAEQEKIATFLTAIDKRINLLTIQKEQLVHYKNGLMKKIFTQELRFKDESGEEFPEWEETFLHKVCQLKNGYAFKSGLYNENGEYIVITISNVQNGFMDLSSCNKIISIPNDIQEHQVLENEDLLISLTGNVGRVCFVNKNNCLLNQRVGKLVPFGVSKKFLFQLLRTKEFQNEMVAIAQGGAQPNLCKGDINNYRFFLPCDKEQLKISFFLSVIDNQIEQVINQIDESVKYKKGILQKMFI
jgi:type I restriction enzyme S subunit